MLNVQRATMISVNNLFILLVRYFCPQRYNKKCTYASKAKKSKKKCMGGLNKSRFWGIIGVRRRGAKGAV